MLAVSNNRPALALSVQGFAEGRSEVGAISGESFSFVTGAPFATARSILGDNFSGIAFLPGVTDVTPRSLQGVDIFVLTPTNRTLSMREADALESFVNNGGALLEIADHAASRPWILGTLPGRATAEVNPISVNAASPLITGAYGPPVTTDLRFGFNYAYSSIAQIGALMTVAASSAGANILQVKPAPGRIGAAVFIGDSEIFMDGDVLGERSGELLKSTHNKTLLLNTFAFLSSVPGSGSSSGVVVTYTPDNSQFPNPERGFFRASEAHSWNALETDYSSLDRNVLEGYRQAENITLIKRYFYLDGFVNSAIPQWYLDRMQRDFDSLREAGLKAVIRFAYANQSMSPPYRDADKARVLMHLDQLQPLLRNNVDVIAVVEAGFIGNWGEWFFTDHFVADPGDPSNITPADYVNRGDVLKRILDAVPASRAVQIRTPHYKYQIYGSLLGSPALPVPLNPSNALDGSDIARTGHHNDCFLGNESDGGTYGVWVNIADDRNYLAAETRYVPMGGEACEPGLGQPRFDCGSAVAELAQFHWSYLNVATGGSGSAVYDGWDAGGCLGEIKSRLGYRLVLVQGVYPAAITSGDAFTVLIQLRNDGWASPINPRPVNLVLRHTVSGAIHTIPLRDVEPRSWEAGGTHTIRRAVRAKLPLGDYEMLLHLPDAAPSLSGRPEFAIRMANVGLWEDATGYNKLGHVLAVRRKESGLLTIRPPSPAPVP